MEDTILEEIIKSDNINAVLTTDLLHLYFDDYIKCAVDGDYKCLIVSGNPNEVEQFLAWQHLYSQFLELTGNKEAVAYIKRTFRMEALNTRITHVTAIASSIELLFPLGEVAVENIGKLAAMLSEWGYTHPFTAESALSDLKKVRIGIGKDRIKLQNLIIEQEKEDKKKGKKATEPPSRKYYFKLLHAIEGHKKMVFDRSKLNMYEFGMYINEIVENSK